MVAMIYGIMDRVRVRANKVYEEGTMKRFVATMLAAAVMGGAAILPAQAESWYYVGPNMNGRVGYIDNDSVEKTDHSATLRLKIMDQDGQHSIMTIFINKDNNTMSPMETTSYNAEGYAVDTYTFPPNSYVSIQPGSNLEIIKNLIW